MKVFQSSAAASDASGAIVLIPPVLSGGVKVSWVNV